MLQYNTPLKKIVDKCASFVQAVRPIFTGCINSFSSSSACLPFYLSVIIIAIKILKYCVKDQFTLNKDNSNRAVGHFDKHSVILLQPLLILLGGIL